MGAESDIYSDVAPAKKTPAYIHRHTDPHHGLGWSVAIRRGGKSYQRQFGDRRHGGQEKAHEAAEAYLKTLLSVLPKPVLLRRKRAQNSTGVIGVLRIREKIRSGRMVEYFRASCPKVSGGIVYRKFSTEKYGYEQAFKLAVAARQDGLEKIQQV